MADEGALGLEMRRRIYAAVERYPGLHLREMARQLDTSVALVEYHVPILVDAGLITVEGSGRYRRLFALEGHTLTSRQKRWVALLRQDHVLHIVLCLLEHGPMRHKELAEGVGLAKSKLSFHIKKLDQAGMVTRSPEGRLRLAERELITRLLATHRPTGDLRSRFAELWLAFYGEDD